jgi:NADPH-dependent ferric siderophore reductase
MDDYDLAVDFMDMTNDRRLWTRLQDARAGFVPIAGRHVIVGDEDAVPAVARVLFVDAEGHVELEVLPGSVDSHRDLLRR